MTLRPSVEAGNEGGTVRVRRGMQVWSMDEVELFDLYRAINDFIATSPGVQERYVERLTEGFQARQLPIKPTQHCTSEECPYTQSHTASWCYYEQPRRCDCPFCYPSR